MLRKADRYAGAVIAALAAVALVFSSGCDRLRDDYWYHVKKGNSHFSSGDFDTALKEYHNAELLKPESDVLDHNMGNVFYKQKNMDKAVEKYSEALTSSEKDVVANAHYNTGNAYYRQDKLDEAILEYKRALEIRPDDVEAKYNLELARAKLKEKMQEQAKQQQQQQQQKKDPHEKNKLPDEKKDENKKCPNPQQGQQQQQAQQKKKQQQEKAGGDEDEAEKKEQEKKQAAAKPEPGNDKKEEEKKKAGGEKKKDGEMSEEEANRILRALDNREKKDREKMTVPYPVGDYRPEKDW